MLIALFGSIILVAPALADKDEPIQKPWKKVKVSLGGSLLNVRSTVRVGAKGIGVSVNPEELFNMDSTTSVFRIDGFWRFSKNLRHRLDASWFKTSNKGDTVLGKDVDIGDTTLPLGTEVKTNLEFDVIKVGYSYSFYQDDRIDLAVGGGLYVLPIKYNLSASGLVNESQTESITAPLPLLGLRADFAITPKWILRNNVDLFYLKISDYLGGIVDVRIGVEYNPFKNVGFGLSTEALNLRVEAEKGTDVPGVDFNGAFEIEQIGLFGYLNIYF